MLRKVLALLAAGLLLVFLAQEFGLVRLPFSTGQAVEATQRAFGRGRRQAERIEEIPVLTARVTRRDAPVTIDAVGSVQSLASVVVRAQVEGRLNEIRFRDGQDVTKGDVLAVIDARSYQAAHDQAVAKKAQDAAQLANARLDLERSEKLNAASFGSRQQLDTARASVAQLEALLQVDDAIIANARITLDHAIVRAPISGRTGLRAIDAGNLVRAADSGLVTITQMQPIGALFALPQQNLAAVNTALARGPLKALVLDADNATVLETGEVETLDNQVDAATGTVRIRAVFPNAQKLLWPGQFVNIRIEVDINRQALTVPTAAVQRGPRGTFVYVVRDDMTVTVAPVAVARQDDRIAILRSGVEDSARIVTSGFMLLKDGTRVKPTDADAPVADAAPETQRPRRDGAGRSSQTGGASPVTR
ncbi:MAG: multidrug resistance protein MdtA [Pseudomonadota bacterium]